MSVDVSHQLSPLILGGFSPGAGRYCPMRILSRKIDLSRRSSADARDIPVADRGDPAARRGLVRIAGWHASAVAVALRAGRDHCNTPVPGNKTRK